MLNEPISEPVSENIVRLSSNSNSVLSLSTLNRIDLTQIQILLVFFRFNYLIC